MTDVITKVSIGGQVYPFGGWSSEWQEVVYLTQAEYDALPASKLTDGKIYKVKTTGVVPGGSADASDVEYDNTTSGLQADNVQDAIDEVNSKSEQMVTINWDILIPPINVNATVDGTRYWVFGAATTIYPVFRSMYSSGWQDTCVSTTTWATLKTYLKDGSGWNCIAADDKVYIYNGSTAKIVDLNTLTDSTVSFSWSSLKTDWTYIYTKTSNTYKKYSWANPVAESSSSTEWDAIPDWTYYKGKYYSLSGKNIIVKDSTWTTVKTIEDFWYNETINIFNDKIYKMVNGVAYAIATI